ncbi:50S ribosomal protein L23 [Candidatus Pacearchaeota archaeon]|nr:50S ribosomal protein L23 [Candidatus Pacearchaeota archaeon]
MIKKPLTTEKAIRLIELENIIVFEVDSKDTRTNIKKGVEKIFNIKVDKVNVLNKGSRKFAYVKLNKKNPAIDIATKLGMI